ncbi:MAG TPA: AtpZ/AtpI family protein [Deltaproteobacteria bacterium]|nr:AtpZ/AtpI family protein [Deltaproteobacteria bacterium]HQI81372.1 AtpZ/AtpI family protein [Deltaproteobacteria bacterium]
MENRETRKNDLGNLNELIMLSAWGAVLVIASFLFLFAGVKMDALLGTGPFFMLGMLILAVFLIMGRLYIEFKKTSDRMGPVKRRHV